MVEDLCQPRSRWFAAADDACGRGICQLDQAAGLDGMIVAPLGSGLQAIETAACTETVATQSA